MTQSYKVKVTEQKRLGYTDLTFAFKQFAVGLRAVPVRFSVLDKKFDITAIGFNFYWRPDFLRFDNFLKSHILLGVENLGLTSDLNTSVFRYDIKTTFATLKTTPFKHFDYFNIYISSSTNMAEKDKYVTSLGVSWEYPNSKFFVKNITNGYYYLEVNTSEYSKIGIMINPKCLDKESQYQTMYFYQHLVLI